MAPSLRIALTIVILPVGLSAKREGEREGLWELVGRLRRSLFLWREATHGFQCKEEKDRKGLRLHSTNVRDCANDFADSVIDFLFGCVGGERESHRAMDGMQGHIHG